MIVLGKHNDNSVKLAIAFFLVNSTDFLLRMKYQEL